MSPDTTTAVTKPADPFDSLPAVHQRRLDAFRDEVRYGTESLDTFRGVEAHHDAEIARLEAENEALNAELAKVPPAIEGGAHEAYALKVRIVRNELQRDIALDENHKLQPQIEESEAAIDTAERAVEAFRKDLS